MTQNDVLAHLIAIRHVVSMNEPQAREFIVAARGLPMPETIDTHAWRLGWVEAQLDFLVQELKR